MLIVEEAVELTVGCELKKETLLLMQELMVEEVEVMFELMTKVFEVTIELNSSFVLVFDPRLTNAVMLLLFPSIRLPLMEHSFVVRTFVLLWVALKNH